MHGARDTTLTSLGEGLAGGLSGGVTRTLLSPLDVLKIRLQLSASSASALQEARGILAREGARGFWRGSGTGVALWVAYMAVQFPAYRRARRGLEGWGSLAPLAPLLAGGLAGVAATVATYPLDWARTRLAAGGAAGGAPAGALGPLRLFASTPPRQWYSGLPHSV